MGLGKGAGRGVQRTWDESRQTHENSSTLFFGQDNDVRCTFCMICLSYVQVLTIRQPLFGGCGFRGTALTTLMTRIARPAHHSHSFHYTSIHCTERSSLFPQVSSYYRPRDSGARSEVLTCEFLTSNVARLRSALTVTVGRIAESASVRIESGAAPNGTAIGAPVLQRGAPAEAGVRHGSEHVRFYGSWLKLERRVAEGCEKYLLRGQNTTFGRS